MTLHMDDIEIIKKVFHCQECDILNIRLLNKGMTNHSFVFECFGAKYIIRVPGEGTCELINRYHEASVYEAIENKGVCESPVYIDAQSGYKITKYIENVRTCNPKSEKDVVLCINKLKSFHHLHLKVNHSFDLFDTINRYESIMGGKSVFSDYQKTKENIFSLKPFIENNTHDFCLSHIDSVPDNFLFDMSRNDDLRIQLTDFEYSGMQDPHMDIAMFCIYAGYDKGQTDKVIDLYFNNGCPKDTRTKIYAYIAACGLLWSNWCEYKALFGIEFGEYALSQYNYAKTFYQIAKNQM